MTKQFTFRQTVPKGTPPNSPGQFQLLIFEDFIPFWGEIVSFDAAIFRDEARAGDIYTYSLGITRHNDGRLSLKFQTWDLTVASIVEHQYRMEVNFYFC